MGTPEPGPGGGKSARRGAVSGRGVTLMYPVNQGVKGVVSN